MQNSHNSMYNNPENGQKEHKDTAGLDRDLSLSPGISSGFYRTADEHDACGIGIVADLKKGPSHRVIFDALNVLKNLEHRGAVGGDQKTGDGAGLLCKLPLRFFMKEMNLPSSPASEFIGIAMLFLPSSYTAFQSAQTLIASIATQRGFQVLGWREVPVFPQVLGAKANATLPRIWQLALSKPAYQLATPSSANYSY